jgi:hypothetical protein
MRFEIKNMANKENDWKPTIKSVKRNLFGTVPESASVKNLLEEELKNHIKVGLLYLFSNIVFSGFSLLIPEMVFLLYFVRARNEKVCRSNIHF